MTQYKLLTSLQTATLDHDIFAADGSVLYAKGSKIVLFPQTVAEAVIFSDGVSLAERMNIHTHDITLRIDDNGNLVQDLPE